MILPDALERFGPLSEAIQVKGAIALARIARNGMHLDVDRLDGLRAQLDGGLTSQVAELLRRAPLRGPCGATATGRSSSRRRDGRPSLSQTRLRELLEQAASDGGGGHRPAGPDPPDRRRATSRSRPRTGRTRPVRPAGPRLDRAGQDDQALQFFAQPRRPGGPPAVHAAGAHRPDELLDPNIQNLPRKGGLREAFVASPGHVLLIVDYSFIELRTLAAVCEARYGSSRLAEVIRAGVDPHAYTAAMFEGMESRRIHGPEDERTRGGSRAVRHAAAAGQGPELRHPGRPGAEVAGGLRPSRPTASP